MRLTYEYTMFEVKFSAQSHISHEMELSHPQQDEKWSLDCCSAKTILKVM